MIGSTKVKVCDRMNKLKLTEDERCILSTSDEGITYLEYNEKIGGEPIGLFVPFGYPKGVEQRGGVIAIYKECIKKGVKWEKLLKFKLDDDVIY